MSRLARVAEDLAEWNKKVAAAGRKLLVRDCDGEVNEFDRIDYDPRWKMIIIRYRKGRMNLETSVDEDSLLTLRKNSTNWRMIDNDGEPLMIYES